MVETYAPTTEAGTLLGTQNIPTGYGWIPPTWLDSFILASAFLYGINGGIFFIFSICIMPALSAISDEEGIVVMQIINDVIQNALFFLVFMGAFALSVAMLVVLPRKSGAYKYTYWKYCLVSSLSYIGGCMLVTIAANVPRNDALAAMDADSSAASDYWRGEYLSVWVAWNHVRTAFCCVSCVLAILAFRLKASV